MKYIYIQHGFHKSMFCENLKALEIIPAKTFPNSKSKLVCTRKKSKYVCL